MGKVKRAIYDVEQCAMVEVDEATYLRMLKRSLCDLIHLAKDNGLNDTPQLHQAKELIRCRVQECGLAGACDGVGSRDYPCPIARPTKERQ